MIKVGATSRSIDNLSASHVPGDAAPADIIFASLAPGKASLLVSFVEHISASVAARGHTSRVRVSVACCQLMAVCTASAVGTQVEVAVVLARVAAPMGACIARFAAGVAPEVIATCLVHKSAAGTHFLLVVWHEYHWVTAFARVRTMLIIAWLGSRLSAGRSGSLRLLLLRCSGRLSASFADVVVASAVIAAVVTVSSLETRTAQVAEQTGALGDMTC